MNCKRQEKGKLGHVVKIPLPFAVNVILNRAIKIHVYGKRQTSDSSWEFLGIENKQIKSVPNKTYG